MFTLYDFLCIMFFIFIYGIGYIHGTITYHLIGKNSKYLIVEKDKYNLIPKE